MLCNHYICLQIHLIIAQCFGVDMLFTANNANMTVISLAESLKAVAQTPFNTWNDDKSVPLTTYLF